MLKSNFLCHVRTKKGSTNKCQPIRKQYFWIWNRLLKISLFWKKKLPSKILFYFTGSSNEFPLQTGHCIWSVIETRRNTYQTNKAFGRKFNVLPPSMMGQLILNCPLGVIVWTKIPMKFWQISAIECNKWWNQQNKGTFL